jgi:hypothetical protein
MTQTSKQNFPTQCTTRDIPADARRIVATFQVTPVVSDCRDISGDGRLVDCRGGSFGGMVGTTGIYLESNSIEPRDVGHRVGTLEPFWSSGPIENFFEVFLGPAEGVAGAGFIDGGG